MVSLENEYFNEKQLLENAQERLNKMESLDVEKMTKEQLEARDRVIKGAKEEIEECEELLEEIKEELVEFINNGGEVSEKTKEAINYFEQIRIDFKIVSNRTPEVYTEGYVEINDAEAEDCDWYYYDAQGMPNTQFFVEHNGVDGFKGATDKQKWEVEQFRVDYAEEDWWMTQAILECDEDENRTYVRENLTIIINEGAEIESEIKEVETDSWNQYTVELIPKFNGTEINLAEFMNEKNIIFDPYGLGEDDANFSIENKHIYFEISKDWFEGDDKDREDNLTMYINPEVECIYKQYLTSKLGVYGIASVIYQEKYGKLDESGCDKFASRWEQAFEDFDVAELYLISEEDVERIIKEELEEEDY